MKLDRPTKICILGGGFGGLYTALSLSCFSWFKAGKCQITLIERKDRFLFTPLLYELITGELQDWEIAPSYQKLLAGSGINFCQATVQTVNLKTRQVSLETGEKLTYDYLLLAAGTDNRWADIPGLKTHALTFRTLADVQRLQGKLRLLETSGRQRLRLAVIGGGPNGVELACKLSDRLGKRGQVHLIEWGEDILKGFSAGVRAASYRALQKRPIQLNCQTAVKRIEGDSLTLAQPAGETTLPVDLVVWAAGTQALGWIQQLDCQQNSQGKLLVRPTLQLLDYPEVFALGDIAEICNNKKFVPATAQAAYQQAPLAARNLMAAMGGKGLRSFRYLHLGDMLALGCGEAVVSSFFLNLEGKLAATIRRLAYIMRLPTFRHRWQVLKNLLQRLVGKFLRLPNCQLRRRLAIAQKWSKNLLR